MDFENIRTTGKSIDMKIPLTRSIIEEMAKIGRETKTKAIPPNLMIKSKEIYKKK